MRKLTATLCLALGIVFLSADANANAYEKFLCPEDFQLIQPSTTTVLDKTESIRSYDTNLRGGSGVSVVRFFWNRRLFDIRESLAHRRCQTK